MPLNIPGILAPIQLLFRPRLIVPAFSIEDIRRLDFQALRDAGYRGAVFDKDNCLTLPHEDRLVPELREAWKECRDTFGRDNVLIVSNSAGTRSDAGGIQAESVSHHLSAPVLLHFSLKPSYTCISSIRAYFSSLQRPVKDDELIVVGDRVFTDVVMANRMNPKFRSFPPRRTEINAYGTETREGPLAIWTTGVWKNEAMLIRWCERKLVEAVQRWTVKRPDSEGGVGSSSLQLFIKPKPAMQVVDEKKGVASRLFNAVQLWILRKPKSGDGGRHRRLFVRPPKVVDEQRSMARRLRHKWRRIDVAS